MLNFKLVNDLSQHEQTGPVPISAIFSGDKHSYNIEYSDLRVDLKVRTTVLDDLKIGDFGFDLISKFALTPNILSDTEDLTTANWVSDNLSYLTVAPVQNIDSPDATVYYESILYTYPYYKVEVNDVLQNTNYKFIQTFSAINSETEGEHTCSMYISYEDIDSNPADEDGAIARTQLHIKNGSNEDTSYGGIIIWWNKADGTIVNSALTGMGGQVDHGYSIVRAGDRIWYHVWFSVKNNSKHATLQVEIYPSGYTDSQYTNQFPNGSILLCHPQLEAGGQPTEYAPKVASIGEVEHTIKSEYLAGPVTHNLSAPIETGAILYDALTNKPFFNYEQGENKIYFSATDAYDKILVYKNADNIITRVHPNPRFFTVINYPAAAPYYFQFPNFPFSVCSLTQNPLKQFKVNIPIRQIEQSWKAQLWSGPSIINNRLVSLSGLTERGKLVLDEKVELLTSKIIKTSEAGIIEWVSNNFSSVAPTYYEARSDKISVFFNYDIEIIGIDADKGIIILKENAPNNLKISYSVSSAWKLVTEELNPLLGSTIPTLSIFADGTGHVMYDKNSSGMLHSNGDPMLSMMDTFINYKSLSTINFYYDKPLLIDIRREGGKIINKDSENYNIPSHTAYGFMGVNPTQLNIMVIKVPDIALETIIYNFEEEHPDYSVDTAFSYPLNWETDRQIYLDFLTWTPETSQVPNRLLNELLTSIKTYTPAGIPLSITDTYNNEVYTD